MGIYEIIMLIVAYAFLLFLSLILFVAGSWVMKLLGKIIHVISYPVRKLWDVINDLLDGHAEYITIGEKRFRFYVFGGFKGFLMFACLFLFTIIAAVTVLKQVTDLETLVLTILDNTVLGACLLLLRNIGSDNATQITAAMLFATGFSAGVSVFCSRPLENAKWYIRFIAGVFSLAAMIALAIILEDVFASIGNWGYDTFMRLYERRGGGIFVTFGRIIALVVLAYLAILTFLLVVEQYVSFVAIVPMSIFTYGLISYGITAFQKVIHIPDAAAGVTDWIMTIVLFVVVEVLRNKYDKIDKYAKAILRKIFGGRFKGRAHKSVDFTGYE